MGQVKYVSTCLWLPRLRVAVRRATARARSIDDGTLWRTSGWQVNPKSRVDRRLLENLKELSNQLREEGLERHVGHALIGKLVYLRYLRDRGILSDRKLREWGIRWDSVVDRSTTRERIRELVTKVDDWLNGSVFPIDFDAESAPNNEHFRQVVGVFLGDSAATGQLHLDFRAYDFSHIPIETLSIIYEQFLSVEESSRELGAYYTPLPVVNFMLAELDERCPIQPGMRVLDPSCGSGAFLVQCYRRLVHRFMIEHGNPSPRPTELRDLLERSIFGIDRDGDACRVAELSLVLTLLDYVDPPDLQRTPTFKLPALRNRTIFEGDFFDPESGWTTKLEPRSFHWVVGNPPWRELKTSSDREADRDALDWMSEHQNEYPVVGKQLAQAFAWKAVEFLSEDGMAGLLLPAMVLLSKKTAYRAAFLERTCVVSISNFSNLRRVLFLGRANAAAAAILFSRRSPREAHSRFHTIDMFSPLIANQEANRPERKGRRVETWSITIDSSEMSEVRYSDVISGNPLPFKVAMWGSFRDPRLLSRVARRFPTLGELAESRGLNISQGLELRCKAGSRENLEPTEEVSGKPELDMKALRRMTGIYSIPGAALRTVVPERANVRKRGGMLPLLVCRPPHVIVSAARTFAVFSDEFIVVPPRQIGIAGELAQGPLLRALSLFLSSDFVRYHQFLLGSQSETRGGLSTLQDLKAVPTPFDGRSEEDLAPWLELHGRLVQVSEALQKATSTSNTLIKPEETYQLRTRFKEFEYELNTMVSKLLCLDTRQQWLIHDLVNVRRHLVDGMVGDEAVRPPSKDEVEAYIATLASELDDFVDRELGVTHQVTAVLEARSGMVEVRLVPRGSAATEVELRRAREAIEARRPQWIYFDRNLVVIQEDRTYLLKPMQRMWWTRSQALADADEVVARALEPEKAG